MTAPLTIKSPCFVDGDAYEAWSDDWVSKGATSFTHYTENGERLIRISFDDIYYQDTGEFGKRSWTPAPMVDA